VAIGSPTNQCRRPDVNAPKRVFGDHIEYGHYVNRTAIGPLLTTPNWPVKIKNSADQDEPNAHFIVSVARREEKGFDVNVAAHLLWDVLQGQPGQQPIQAAVIISNDSDIKLPIDQARPARTRWTDQPQPQLHCRRTQRPAHPRSRQPLVVPTDRRRLPRMSATRSDRQRPTPANCGGHGFGHGTRWNRCDKWDGARQVGPAERR
jgi:hypothetical protein